MKGNTKTLLSILTFNVAGVMALIHLERRKSEPNTSGLASLGTMTADREMITTLLLLSNNFMNNLTRPLDFVVVLLATVMFKESCLKFVGEMKFFAKLSSIKLRLLPESARIWVAIPEPLEVFITMPFREGIEELLVV